jgi:raffinose/stachyose/melibiose transport system permease protein
MTDGRRHTAKSFPWRRSLWIASLLTPALVVMVLFVLWPLLSAFRFAFYEFNGLRPAGFIGFENFREVLFETPYSDWTYNALKHNVIAFVALMVFENGTAFSLAYALLKALPGHRSPSHRLPAGGAVGSDRRLSLKLFLHPLFGLVNQILGLVGFSAIPWLGNEHTALGSILFANIWHWLGFPTWCFWPACSDQQGSAGGRSPRRRRRLCADAQIVWPLIAPSVTIVTILTFIGSFNWFEIPYVMAGLTGSPGGSTDGLASISTAPPLAARRQASRISARQRAAVLMFLFVAGVTALALRYLRRREIEL